MCNKLPITLKDNLDDAQTVIKLFPKTVQDIDKKISNAHKESTKRIDILSLQMADNIPANNNATPKVLDIDNIVKLTIDKKLKNLPSLIENKIHNCPTIQHLQSSSTTKLHQVLQDMQKQNKYQQKVYGFHKTESKDFHVSKLLKLLDTNTLTGNSLQDLEKFYYTSVSHFSTVTLNSNILPSYCQLHTTFCFYEHLCCPKKIPPSHQ
jgi:hypothetical protein